MSLRRQEENAIRSLDRCTMLLSQTTEKILRLSMLRNRRDEITKAINDIVGEEEIKSVRILNHIGVIKFSSNENEINKHISRTDELCTNCHYRQKEESAYPVNTAYSTHFHRDSNLIYTSLPIYNSPSCYNTECHESASNKNTSKPVHDSTQTILGFIEMKVSARSIMDDLNRTRFALITLTIVIALLAAGIAYISIRLFIGRPVKSMVEGMRRVAEGNFEQEIPPGRGELGFLAESFNSMQRELSSAQTRLIESAKLASIGKLAKEIANEINNPLTGIIIYVENLIEGSHDENQKRDLELVLDQAMKIRETIRNIFTGNGGRKPEFVNLDVQVIIKHVVSVLGNLSNFKNIRTNVSIQNGLPLILADPEMIEQAIFALFLAFSEDMPAGGLLDISARYLESEKRIEIKFTETGNAVPEDEWSILIEEKGELPMAGTSKIVLTLFVFKQIIELHRGKVALDLKKEEGKVVNILLPVQKDV
ncbi:MAG: HAMP domain-containing protein [Candidatus Kryptoniota bacterium]